MSGHNFLIDYTTDQNELTRRILKSLFIHRQKANKPTIVVFCGDSGEGKSYSTLKLMDALYDMQGIDMSKHLEDVVIFTPLEYAKKVENILFNKDLKDLNIIMIDEAREVMKAKLWYSFVNQAIADINAMSRGVKPLIVFVVTQFIKDIDPASRRTINYYGVFRRPYTQSAYTKLYKVWKDDFDIESPKLRKKPIYGLVQKGNIYMKFQPGKIKFHLPRPEIRNPYEEKSKAAKTKVIRKKLEDLLKLLESEFKGQYERLDAIVDFYVKNPESLSLIISRSRGKIRIKKEAVQMHDLSQQDIKEFEIRLTQKLAERGLSANVETRIEPTVVDEVVGQ